MASSNNPSTSDPAPPTASRNNGGEDHQIDIVDIFRNHIWKVPPVVRSHSNNKEKFDPRVVSIGPYHHRKKELQPAEAIKPLVVQLFLDDPHCLRGEDIVISYDNICQLVPNSLRGGEDTNKSIISYGNIRKLIENKLRKDMNDSINYDDIRQLVKAKVGDARSFYDEGSTDRYSDDEFTEMMILDGFFVLALLQSVPSDKIGFNILVCSSLGQLALSWLVKDVTVLVENQIPFPILQLLMKSIFKHPEKGMQIITTHFRFMYSWKMIISGGVADYKREVKASDITDKNPCHLMEVNWWFQYGLDQKPKENPVDDDGPCYFSSVSELKGMGITVAPSNSISPSAVTFKSNFLSGRLQLPPFFVDDGDNRENANMMAYEFTSGSHDLNEFPATAYITFLKALINHAQDVRELRSKYVLFAPGLSDERVLEIVNEPTTFGIDDFYGVYSHVKRGIHDHCNRKWNSWMVELNISEARGHPCLLSLQLSFLY